jgi:nucleotide-binding universal stress UspA family protein
MKKILIATDGSGPSREAVDFGLALAVEHQADVAFVHAVPADEYMYVGRLGPAVPIQHEEPIDESESALREAADAAEEAGVPYTLERISGPTVDAVLTTADEMDADLIVVGSHGRGAIGAALLGSVSRDLVKRARRPVLVVKGAQVPVGA